MYREAANNIAHWLNTHKETDSDYHQGLMLLESYGSDTALLNKLRNFTNHNALFIALRSLWQSLKSQTSKEVLQETKSEALKEVILAPDSSADIRLSAKNALSHKLQSEWKAIRKKSGAWQVQLYWIGRTDKGIALDLNADQKKQRAFLAKQIMDAEKKIIEIQTDINYLSIHGTLPTKEKVARPKKVVGFDYQLYENTRKKIHIAKVNVKLYTDKLISAHIDDIQKINEKIDTWQTKLLELEILFASLKKAKK